MRYDRKYLVSSAPTASMIDAGGEATPSVFSNTGKDGKRAYNEVIPDIWEAMVHASDMDIPSDRELAVRLGELFYHADGFMSLAKQGTLSPPTPWIEKSSTRRT